MATFTIQFSVADEHMDRIRYALRKHFGPVADIVEETITDPETGEQTTTTKTVMRDLDGAELLAKVREMSINNVKSIVMAVEAEDAARLARESVTAVVVE